jgi:DNA gyrase inhibitor GyrI
MSASRVLLLAGLAGFALLVLAGCQATRAGYQTAPYRVIQREGRVEIREYPVLRVVETVQGGDDFMRLFRYISRDNASNQKISMTTPVFMDRNPSGERTMAFVLPTTLTAPPVPKSDRVALREISGGTFAVLRFRGRQQGPDGEAAGRLKAWLVAHPFTALGAPRFAYFDPPWTPGFLRRNEVMIPIRPLSPAP